MSTPILSLEDLDPQEAEFELSAFPGRRFRICKWSLRVRAWALKTFGAEVITESLSKGDPIVISEIVFFMLKDKSDFKSIEDFQDAVVKPSDILSIITALTASIGVSEPKQAELRELVPDQKKTQA